MLMMTTKTTMVVMMLVMIIIIAAFIFYIALYRNEGSERFTTLCGGLNLGTNCSHRPVSSVGKAAVREVAGSSLNSSRDLSPSVV